MSSDDTEQPVAENILAAAAAAANRALGSEPRVDYEPGEPPHLSISGYAHLLNADGTLSRRENPWWNSNLPTAVVPVLLGRAMAS